VCFEVTEKVLRLSRDVLPTHNKIYMEFVSIYVLVKKMGDKLYEKEKEYIMLLFDTFYEAPSL
jgi:hypothetical protein